MVSQDKEDTRGVKDSIFFLSFSITKLFNDPNSNTQETVISL